MRVPPPRAPSFAACQFQRQTRGMRFSPSTENRPPGPPYGGQANRPDGHRGGLLLFHKHSHILKNVRMSILAIDNKIIFYYKSWLKFLQSTCSDDKSFYIFINIPYHAFRRCRIFFELPAKKFFFISKQKGHPKTFYP